MPHENYQERIRMGGLSKSHVLCMLRRHKPLLLSTFQHIQFNNFDWTTSFYWSYMLLLKPPALCTLELYNNYSIQHSGHHLTLASDTGSTYCCWQIYRNLRPKVSLLIQLTLFGKTQQPIRELYLGSIKEVGDL